MVTQWKVHEAQNGYQYGEYGHLILAFISQRNKDSFLADEG